MPRSRLKGQARCRGAVRVEPDERAVVAAANLVDGDSLAVAHRASAAPNHADGPQLDVLAVVPAALRRRRSREGHARDLVGVPLLLERAGQVRAQHLLRHARRRKLLRLGQHPVAAQPRRADKPPPAVACLVRPERAAGAASVEGGLDGRRRLVAVKAEGFRIAVPQSLHGRLLILPSVSVDPEAAEQRCIGGGGHRQEQEDQPHTHMVLS